MSTKKILMLLETRFPPDERVEKEIVSLKENGYEVHIACSSRFGEPEEEIYKEIPIYRLKISKLWYKLGALVLVFPFYLSKWSRFVNFLCEKESFDVLHVHDLPLSRVGLKMKRKFGAKLVCDQHEYYSNWIVDTAHYNTLFGRFVKLLSNWKRYEKKHLEAADLVITVEEPLREEYLSEYNLPEEKLIILPNTPSKKVFNKMQIETSIFREYEDSFVLLYFGGIDILRGIDQVIEAIPLIIKKLPNFKFVLAGKCYGGYDPMKSAREIGVEDYVDFIGWIDLKQIPSLIEKSDVGIFTPPSMRKEINKTIATKNYQFLVLQKPMIVGKAAYMKAFTEENGIGISIDEESPDSIAKGVTKLATDEKFSSEVKAQCKQIGDKYFWEETSRSLLKAYESMLI